MITKLPNRLINQIAAGEVVERPASALKELAENSIDAGASKIEVKIIEGGKSLISVKDNGSGINKDELPLAIERFATSKLNDNNLFNIHTFGFRGEALASICSIARVSIKSRAKEAEEAYELAFGDDTYEISPTSLKCGTTIEVRDLFYATPARLKFLKSTNAESDACYTVLCNIALVNPAVEFKYFENGKLKLSADAVSDVKSRVANILGDEFIQNTKYVESEQNDIKIHGFIGVPNYNKSTQMHQWLFINGRPIKDKLIASNIRNAYKSVIPIGQYPAFLLYIDMPADAVDVNVHPTKTEVRFRDAHTLISIITKLITTNLSELAQQASTALSRMGLYEISKEQPKTVNAPLTPSAIQRNTQRPFQSQQIELNTPTRYFFPERSNNTAASTIKLSPENSNQVARLNVEENCEYGRAIAQVDATYIISQKGSELFIVDQHAVCERITLEKLLNRDHLESQQLLIPEIVTLNKSLIDVAEQQKELLFVFGIQLERIAVDEICIKGIPSIFSGCDSKKLITDILEELSSVQNTESFKNKVRYVYATTACHRSVRAGKVLTFDEMNDLLHQMQKTKNIAQCCHGRPSYIKFSVNDLKKMFER